MSGVLLGVSSLALSGVSSAVPSGVSSGVSSGVPPAEEGSVVGSEESVGVSSEVDELYLIMSLTLTASVREKNIAKARARKTNVLFYINCS